jgi:hypothetical protein
MPNFLTKQEIIEKLQSLPNLPVVIDKESDDRGAFCVSSIIVVEASKGRTYTNCQEYNLWGCHEFDEKVIVLY